MNATKFTPGPWHWVNGDNDKPRKPGEWRSSLRTVYERQTKSVGPLPWFILEAEEIYDEAMEANASLIAAAPELYEALARIMPFVDDAEDAQNLFPESACSTECREAVKLCRAALAKAVQP